MTVTRGPEEPQLTPRERDVLRLVAHGMTKPQIARLLWFAPSTVRKHLENVYPKLGVHTRTAAGLGDTCAPLWDRVAMS
jgi:two-component system nitrate/nitrite response regulator NarL